MFGFTRPSDPVNTAENLKTADTADTADTGGQTYPKARTDEQWREVLSPQEYQVLRLAGTERAYTGEYTSNHEVGVYSCRACGTELFRSEQKFDSHCGWPSFYSALAGDRVEEIEDRSFGSVRTEVRCAACGSHMGHVFAGEGFDTPTDLRYCINSLSMRFEPAPPEA